VAAAHKLFSSGVCRPESIDFLLLCTQSPDYFLPTTACILQDRLGLPTSAGALDFNLGCSGFVYGLSLAKGLIETGQAANVLLLTAETYSKFLHPEDRGVRALFGDAAAATLLQARHDAPAGGLPWIGPFVFGTDGKGMNNLIVAKGGMRRESADVTTNGSVAHLHMNGPEIFTFTLNAVPQAVKNLLKRAGKGIDDIDLFVFHQANRFMLDHLRDRLEIPKEKFVVSMSHCGNTVSSTIPIALRDAVNQQVLHPGQLVMLVGFGVGYSWGATLIRTAM
jgi:3-oxoacyl-[acyl-carrier-protein] synthase-3